MIPLESALLGILVILLTGYCGFHSIRSPVMRTICVAVTVGAFWMLVIVAGKEMIAWVIADLFQ